MGSDAALVVSPATDVLSITLPSSLGATVPTLTLKILSDKNGKRSITRQFRDANASDAGRIRRVEWEICGPIGASLYSSSQRLGIDFCRNLESRWERRLVSSIAQTTVDLTGDDPPGTGAYFGSAYFGSSYFGTGIGGPGGDDPAVVVFAEQQGYLLVYRGFLATQVDLSNWSLVETKVLDADVLDAEHWRSKVRVALGSNVPMQTLAGVSSGGQTYEDTVSTSPAGEVFASAVKRGSDRAWFIDADENDGTLNEASFTLDGFETLAAPFQVGDPDVGVTGIGAFGPVTDFGSEDNIYSFTDQGKPVPLSKALDAIHSTMNGSKFADPGFGWLYYLSIAGLRAHDLRGNDNPIGIGERMRGFTGHNGLCTAIFAARGELWAIWETTAGDLYGYRGTFGPETAGTGQPLFFPWFYMASQTCEAIFSSTTPNFGTQSLTIVRGAGTNMTYMTIADNGRDDLGPTVYSTAGGSAYGTTFDKDPNLLKTHRLCRLRARGMTTGSSWTIGMAFDSDPINPTAATYVTLGTVTTDGFKTLTAIAGGADAQGNPTPTANISGHTAKPRWVQVAAGSGASSTPPELNGTFEWEYDERPEQIEEIAVEVQMEGIGRTDNENWQYLQQLVGSQTSGPFRIQLPDDMAPAVAGASGGGQKYAMLNSVTKRTDASPNVESVVLTFSVWPQADALSA